MGKHRFCGIPYSTARSPHQHSPQSDRLGSLSGRRRLPGWRSPWWGRPWRTGQWSQRRVLSSGRLEQRAARQTGRFPLVVPCVCVRGCYLLRSLGADHHLSQQREPDDEPPNNLKGKECYLPAPRTQRNRRERFRICFSFQGISTQPQQVQDAKTKSPFFFFFLTTMFVCFFLTRILYFNIQILAYFITVLFLFFFISKTDLHDQEQMYWGKTAFRSESFITHNGDTKRKYVWSFISTFRTFNEEIRC